MDRRDRSSSRQGPKPIAWEPSGLWDGIDGPWSSFTIRTGTPGQTSRVLPATAGVATWVVHPIGCNPSAYTAPDCPSSRGGIFRSNASTTWINQGNYALGIEQNLGSSYNVSGNYGLDTISLGNGNATEGPSLNSQVVAGIGSNMYYTGMFGLRHSPTNLSSTANPMALDENQHPSYLASLKTKNMIPSMSWAYTAGAWYRNGSFGALASLTFGGYDARRFTPNNVSFSLAPDISRDLVVGLQSITSVNRNLTNISLLSTPIQTFIDSTIPWLNFPQEVCDAFAENFGLEYDSYYQMYFVSEKTHVGLSKVNPNITFTLGNSLKGGPTVDIVLPYSAFNLSALFPLVSEPARYFPLSVASNESMYTLGRPFLQEAYLITNYEHQNFSISQTRFDNLNSTQKDLVALPAATVVDDPNTDTGNPPIVPTVAPTSTATPGDNGGLSHQAKVGVIAGTTAAVAISFLILALILWRWRKYKNSRRGPPLGKPQKVTTLQKVEMDGHGVSYKARFVPVAPTGITDEKKAVYTTTTSTHPDTELGSHGEIYEIPGPDNPEYQELMTQPPKAARGQEKRKAKKSYAGYMGNKFSRSERRGREDAALPPVSNFCAVPVNCLRGRLGGGEMTNLNRSLPPTPLFSSPAPTRLTSSVPNTRWMARDSVQ